jgi:hypothetical protein
VLPEFEQRLVERLLSRFYDHRVLTHVEQQVRLGHTVRSDSVTLFETRRALDDPMTWLKTPIAQFRFDPSNGLWSLYWHDRNRRWRRYGHAAATRNFETLLAEVDRDPTRIFWG